MAHHRLGHADAARQWFDKAVKTVDKDRKQSPQALKALGMHPHNWITWLLLRREAEALFNETGR